MIPISWKCVCKQQEQTFHVATRGEGESMQAFMDRVRNGVQDSHQELSPRCLAGKFEYIRIPVDPDGKVGHKP